MPNPPPLYLEHPADVLDYVVRCRDAGRPCALVLVANTEGGSVRAAGTLIAVRGDGQMAGYVSNGCIDQDLVAQAKSAMAEGRVRRLRYGRGSPFFDLRLPCGGSVDLLVDPAPTAALITKAHRLLIARKPSVLKFAADAGLVAIETGEHPEGGLRCLCRPRARLSLAGRGAVLQAVARQARLMGMEIALASPDAADLAALQETGPVLSQHLVDPTAGVTLPCDADTAVLLLFHDHEWEIPILAPVLKQEAAYIGCLGSHKTHALRCAALVEAGVPPEAIARIHSPIGLVPSLRNASELATSALAEILQVIRQTARPDCRAPETGQPCLGASKAAAVPAS